MNNLDQHTSLKFECMLLIYKCCTMFIGIRYFYCRLPIVKDWVTFEIPGGLIRTKISTGFLGLTTKPDILQIVKNMFLWGLVARRVCGIWNFWRNFDLEGSVELEK